MIERVQRIAHGGHFQRDTQSDLFRIFKPCIGTATLGIGKSRQTFDTYRLVCEQRMDRLVKNGDGMPVEHVLHALARRGQFDLAAHRIFDPLRRQTGEGTQDAHVAGAQTSVGYAAERAETSPDATIGQAERHVQMASDRQKTRDTQCSCERVVRRIEDQFGQATFKDVPAIAVFYRLAVPRTHRQIEVGADMRQLALPAFDIAADESDLEPEVAAHCSQYPLDRFVVQKIVAKGTGRNARFGQLYFSGSHTRMMAQII